MKNIKDDLIKIAFLIICALFVYQYYLNNNVGRYIQIQNAYGFPLILDTKNGATYRIPNVGGEKVEVYTKPISN